MAAHLRAGAAQTDITPPLGVEMCGYGPNEKRVCTEVLDPLFARALWLETPDAQVVLISTDLCMVDFALRDEVAETIAARIGIDPRAVMITASHTHSGPVVQYLIAWGEVDADYRAQLCDKLVATALTARQAAEPAKLGGVRQRIIDVGVNREQPALAATDPSAQLLRVDTLDGRTLAVLFNFGAHGVVRYPFTSRLSADWMGLVAATLSLEFHGAPALFLQGPCGDINGHAMDFERNRVVERQQACDMRAGETAARLCRQIIPALKDIRTVEEVELSAQWEKIVLPCIPPDRAELEARISKHLPIAERMTLAELRPLYQRMPDETEEEVAWRWARYCVDVYRRQLELLDNPPYQQEVPVQILRLGNAALVGWPGEIFVDLGIELRQRSPVPLTFVSSFANGDIGYIPTAAAFESQGKPNQFGIYPVAMTPEIYGTLPFRSDVGRILVEETLKMLNQPLPV